MNEKKLALSAPVRTGLFFDTETTGLPAWKEPSDDPKQPHLTQLGAILANLDTQEIISSIDLVVKPDGWDIPDVCVELNGIGNEYALAVGLPEVQVVEMFISMLGSATRFAFNTTFDNRIIRIALKRYFSETDMDSWKAGKYECQMIAARKHLGGKQPKLIDAYKEICGKDLIDAHTALADARACMEVYFALQDINAESGDVFK